MNTYSLVWIIGFAWQDSSLFSRLARCGIHWICTTHYYLQVLMYFSLSINICVVSHQQCSLCSCHSTPSPRHPSSASTTSSHRPCRTAPPPRAELPWSEGDNLFSHLRIWIMLFRYDKCAKQWLTSARPPALNSFSSRMCTLVSLHLNW